MMKRVSLSDLLEEIGEEGAKLELSDFCSINSDVQDFFRNLAIAFEQKGLSTTTLIYDKRRRLLGGYSLSPYSLRTDNLNEEERIELFGKEYKDIKTLPAILIGQLSKNYYGDNNLLITGEEILAMIFENIVEIASSINSAICYVDCEDVPELKEFYETNGFQFFKEKKMHGKKYLCYIILTKSIVEIYNSKDE